VCSGSGAFGYWIVLMVCECAVLRLGDLDTSFPLRWFAVLKEEEKERNRALWKVAIFGPIELDWTQRTYSPWKTYRHSNATWTLPYPIHRRDRDKEVPNHSTSSHARPYRSTQR
jgi:hypothetical protein